MMNWSNCQQIPLKFSISSFSVTVPPTPVAIQIQNTSDTEHSVLTFSEALQPHNSSLTVDDDKETLDFVFESTLRIRASNVVIKSKDDIRN